MSSFSPKKDIITEEANKSHVLPTLFPYEASSHEQEDEGLSSEDNAHANKEEGDFDEMEKTDTAVLLSEEELVDLLKKETEEELEAEERALQEEEMETDKDNVEFGGITEDEEAEVEEKMLDDEPKMEEEDEEVGVENVEEDEMLVKEEVDVEKVPLEEEEEQTVKKMADREEQGAFSEDSDGSTESEIPADLDYAADSGLLQPLQIVSARKHPVTDDKQPLSKTAHREKETSEKGLPIIEDDFEPDLQNIEAADSGEASDQVEDVGAASEEMSADKKEKEPNTGVQEPRSSAEIETGSRVAGKEEDKSKNDSGSLTNRKTRRQKKNQRARKHSPQNEDPQSGQEQSQESDGSSTDNTVHKAKRRRAGKWVMKLLFTAQGSLSLLGKPFSFYFIVSDKVNPLTADPWSGICMSRVAQPDLDLEHFEATSCRISLAVTEQVMWCGSTHCPVGGPARHWSVQDVQKVFWWTVCVISHVNAGIQAFPAEHCTEARRCPQTVDELKATISKTQSWMIPPVWNNFLLMFPVFLSRVP